MIKKNIIALFILAAISITCVENHVLNLGQVKLTSTPSGAAIDIDGKPSGKVTPVTFSDLLSRTEPYIFTLHLTGYRDTSVSLEVKEGSETEKHVNLTLYEPRGSITINSNPQGAQIFKNNTNTGLLTPATIKKVEAGTYSIKLHKEEYYDTTLSVTVLKDKNTNVGTVVLRKIPIYTITASTKPAGAGSISGTGTFRGGDTVRVSTSANSGYKFVNWSEQNNIVSTAQTYIFVATKNRTLVANYVQVGTLIVDSNPAGAKIFLNGEDTNFLTPHTFANTLAGQYIVTLKKQDFADTSVTVLVNRNQTTNTGAIYLRDILPDVTVNLKYSVNADGKLIFTFSFNQDINLNKVEFTKPAGTTLTQNYGGQFVPKGREIDLPYPEKITGTWLFKFYGNKAGGRQKVFTVEKKIDVN